MRIWIPSLDKKGHTRFILNEDFSFNHVDVSPDKQKLVTVAISAITDCRFQILFEIALNHFAKEQFRDSIVSAYAALEQFREHYLLASFIERKYSTDTISGFWSSVGSQSERQLGAYHAAVLLREGVAAKEISSNHTNFRNKTIHQGKFPKEKDTLEFLESIFTNIFERINAQESVGIFIEAKLFEYQKRKPNDVTDEISINPLLDIERRSQEDITKQLHGHIKYITSAAYEDAIATWPNKNTLQVFNMDAQQAARPLIRR
ncbi:MAG: hypothetical protein Q7U82_11970 [Gammaproteobacteria bacterium]|nr:hypothetical protein [Gammaproteobacteria bacterium]